MKKFFAVLLTILLLFGVTAIAVSAAEVTIEGGTTDNAPVTSTFGDRTVEANKTIEAIEPMQSVDVKLTLKFSQPSPTPSPTDSGSGSGAPAKTGDGSGMIGFVLALFVSAVAGSLLFRKKTRKPATSLLLVVCLLAVLAPAGAIVFAQSAGYTITELFTEETLAGFTFDRVVSSNISAVDTVEDAGGRVIGLTWATDVANVEQSIVYRLTLNENIPEAAIGTALNVSGAQLVFTDAQGKTSALTYPEVSVKLNQNAPALARVEFLFNKHNHREYEGNTYPEGVTQSVTPDSMFTLPTLNDVFPESMMNPDEFLGWKTDSGTEYSPYNTVLVGIEGQRFYAVWKSCPPIIDPVFEGETQITGTGVSGSIVTLKGMAYPASTTVDSEGRWTIYVPGGSVLLKGMVIEGSQQEAGYRTSCSVYITVQ